MSQTVTLIRGDGIGPEIADATLRVLEASGAKIDWEERVAGEAAVRSHGAPLPPETVDSIRVNGLALKGPLATPVGGGYRSVNVAIRQELDLFANVRPVRSFQGVASRYQNIDLVVVRENTQGLYSGIEFYTDRQKNSAQAISLVTRMASERVIRYAFEHCRRHQRKRLTVVHKANILKFTTGLFLEVAKDLAREYPDVELEDRIVDSMAMQLVLKPERFEVIVTTNLFGDILSDLTAGLVGGLGLAPSENIGEHVVVFEPVHGTAPDIAGKGVANPTALILSACMLLRRLGYLSASQALEKSIARVLAEGKVTTPDLGGSASTSQYASALIANL
ncbi:MAG: isocitrate/isopropylmalate dehydrogenase family protein [Deltaproteobacteria bacterium]|nr:isocitrate/isopropylmalate dehydrogenase family protein [Deltaproteobacteria bacterium]